jgi:SAM-dependent methyltransferase
MIKCRICGNIEGNKEYIIKEMHFGFGEEFVYFQCENCGCFQIKNIPYNLPKYYPSNYYSFNPANLEKRGIISFVKTIFKLIRNSYAIFNHGLVGKIIYSFYPYEALRSLSRVRLNKNSKILDVGCGTGKLLLELRGLGFTHLVGIDPYIEKDIEYKNGVKILKKTIQEFSESGNNKYDLIMFHHSFEHIQEPFETLEACKRILNPDGIVLIRTPVADSWAWENYRENWVQIDAPRHIFIYSRKSMEILAQKIGFKIKEIIYDSTEFQFWGSEQYKKGIPLVSDLSYAVNRKKSIFSKKQIREFKKLAREFNLKGIGDQAVFYLIKLRD